MRKLMILLAMVATCGLFCSCGDDEWGNNNPEMEHIYYYGLGNVKYPGGNELKYTVKQGESVAIPTYFFSAYTRPYSPVVSYYTSAVAGDGEAQLVCGTDYQVVDKNGNVLSPESNGGYSMTWPNAVQGSQDVYIKALNGAKGKIRVLTFDPTKSMDANDVSSTTIVKTNEYEVRAFTENYYVTVTIQ
ncbi:MAG: hypothetical protein IJ494_01165 [Bacteroides sp.]|nr:hypothetical protein [Bacteroides sp.]